MTGARTSMELHELAVTRWGLRALAVVALLGLAFAVTADGTVSPLILPSPDVIWDALWERIGTAEFRADLWRTLREIAASSAIGVVAGVAVGIASWRFPRFGAVLEPYLAALYAMPTIAFYPILLAVMGLGSGPIILIAAVMVFVPVVLNTVIGLRGIRPVLIKMGRSVNCSSRQLFFKVLLPASAPLVFPGIRLGVMYGVTSTIATEFILADQGLGYRINHDYDNFVIPRMWAGIVIVVLLAMAIMSALSLVERRIRSDLA
ncbi:MAG TPA: ABC transporter permease [Baekduia sp.]|uniref:ABC transporter permease n=1 Tax=Baekduia sp. TaxID=2600305 RepID=UPI002D77A109|nr:ABC transporter permease [Baekduia sp.]HET6509884.1 ABC transporter permease [Baekduia sp.]